MFFLNEPNEQFIARFLERARAQNFSYAEVGTSRTGDAPEDYNVDHNRVKIGAGASDFQKAIQAVKDWKMFAFDWVHLHYTDTPVETGETVAIVVYHLGFWSINAARIVYLVETIDKIEKFGFAYGTLKDHGERGEERFSVEWNRETDEVCYDLFAFSQPAHLLARIGYPFSRALQKRFAADSKTAMLKAVSEIDL